MYDPKMNPFAKQMEERKQRIIENLSNIKFKIAVMSGKGGVGKTTVAINLASMLLEKGKVGILDADIDCPNVNKFLGVTEKFSVTPKKELILFEKHGLKIISMASLQKTEDEAIMWRGPLIANTLTEFLELTKWGEMEFLVFDAPPGTSDIAMSLMQNINLSGIVIVSSPQNVSLLDAKRAINMAKRLNSKVIGLVENMSGETFGEGSVESLAKELGVPFLGRIKLNKKIREITEKQLIPAKEDNEIKKEFELIYKNLIKNL